MNKEVSHGRLSRDAEHRSSHLANVIGDIDGNKEIFPETLSTKLIRDIGSFPLDRNLSAPGLTDQGASSMCWLSLSYRQIKVFGVPDTLCHFRPALMVAASLADSG
jgi:hypothetical protein